MIKNRTMTILRSTRFELSRRIPLTAFRGAMNYTCVDDFSKKATMRGMPCRYYIKGSIFPASNHISILEKTFSWRTSENLSMVEKSYWHCKEIMKHYDDGIIYVNCGQFVESIEFWFNVGLFV